MTTLCSSIRDDEIMHRAAVSEAVTSIRQGTKLKTSCTRLLAETLLAEEQGADIPSYKQARGLNSLALFWQEYDRGRSSTWKGKAQLLQLSLFHAARRFTRRSCTERPGNSIRSKMEEEVREK